MHPLRPPTHPWVSEGTHRWTVKTPPTGTWQHSQALCAAILGASPATQQPLHHHTGQHLQPTWGHPFSTWLWWPGAGVCDVHGAATTVKTVLPGHHPQGTESGLKHNPCLPVQRPVHLAWSLTLSLMSRGSGGDPRESRRGDTIPVHTLSPIHPVGSPARG